LGARATAQTPVCAVESVNVGQGQHSAIATVAECEVPMTQELSIETRNSKRFFVNLMRMVRCLAFVLALIDFVTFLG
jgi:hypothetical protein